MKPKGRGATMTVTEFARLGGLARAAQMTPEERKAASRRALRARWGKKRRTAAA